MRIGLVTPGFSADERDWCIPALRHLARALAAEDDVRVIAVRYPYSTGEYRVDNVTVRSVGGAERRGALTARVWRDALRTLAEEHRRRPFDVLHAFWATESGLLAALASKRLGIPTLVSLAGGELIGLPEIGYGDQRSAWERFKVKTSLRLAGRVSAGSHALFRLAAHHVSTEKLYRAPLGVPRSLFRPLDRPAAGLIHVGTLTPVKDQTTLLRAFRLVRQQRDDACLDVVGDGPLRGSLEALAAQLGVASAVRFSGGCDHADLPERYRAARVCVLSSLHEAQSMVALEAAACGLGVAGTRVGVVPEIAPPALVAEPGDASALAGSMLAALADPQPPDVSDFDLDTCSRRFRALYAELVARQ